MEKGWGRTVLGHNGRRRHAARGTDTSVRVCWVEGTGDVHMEGALLRERRWVAGSIKRGYNNEH